MSDETGTQGPQDEGRPLYEAQDEQAQAAKQAVREMMARHREDDETEPTGEALTTLAAAWNDDVLRLIVEEGMQYFRAERKQDFVKTLEARYAEMRRQRPDLPPQGGAKKSGRGTLLRSLAEFKGAPEPDPVMWLEDFREFKSPVLSIGEVCLLSGEGGLGKSYLTLSIAAAAAMADDEPHGRTCGLRVKPGPVVLVSYEDTPIRMWWRLARMGVEAAAAGLYVMEDPPPLWSGSDGEEEAGKSAAGTGWDELWADVRKIAPPLVVIDPASAALADVDVSQTGPVRKFIRALTAEAKPDEAEGWQGCGVLIVTHSTKAARNAARRGEDPGAGVVAGSAAWYDGARGVLFLDRFHDEDMDYLRTLECVKSNYARHGWGIDLAEQYQDDKKEQFAGFAFDQHVAPEYMRERRGSGGGGKNKDGGGQNKQGAKDEVGDV